MGTPGFECRDCGVDTSRLGIKEYYMVKDVFWRRAGMNPHTMDPAKGGGMLCIGCLERRLGMILHVGCFTAAPVNHDVAARSPRLTDRLTRPSWSTEPVVSLDVTTPPGADRS
jgi:hypothetical protein